jgi:hypothetical protein
MLPACRHQQNRLKSLSHESVAERDSISARAPQFFSLSAKGYQVDDIHKPTHLDQDEMKALLRMLGSAGIRRAIAAWEKGRRPKNIKKFRSPKSWVVLDDSGREHAHRPLIAFACELCGAQVMNPSNFGWSNDGLCRQWFELQGFAVKEITPTSSHS